MIVIFNPQSNRSKIIMKTNKWGIYLSAVITIAAILFCNFHSLKEFYVSLGDMQSFVLGSFFTAMGIAVLFSLEAFSYDQKSGTESTLLEIIEVEMGTVSAEIFCSFFNIPLLLSFLCGVFGAAKSHSVSMGLAVCGVVFFTWCITYFSLFFFFYLIRPNRKASQVVLS
jgi:membrane-associated HD superfamily phosphohydrolase